MIKMGLLLYLGIKVRHEQFDLGETHFCFLGIECKMQGQFKYGNCSDTDKLLVRSIFMKRSFFTPANLRHTFDPSPGQLLC